MGRAVKSIDIDDSPELLRLVEEIRANDEQRVLRLDDQDVAIVQPTKRVARTRAPRGRPTSAEDPLWQLVGAGASEGTGDVSTKKHAHLAAAYADRH